jgi:hypothetical protein
MKSLLFKQGRRFIGKKPPERRAKFLELILSHVKEQRDLQRVIPVMDVILVRTIGG